MFEFNLCLNCLQRAAGMASPFSFDCYSAPESLYAWTVNMAALRWSQRDFLPCKTLAEAGTLESFDYADFKANGARGVSRPVPGASMHLGGP